MGYLTDQEIILTLELPDGSVYHGKAMMVELSISMDVTAHTAHGDQHQRYQTGRRTWDATLKGIGEVTFEPGHDLRQRTHTSKEWRCEWCGCVNPKAATRCQSCSGARSILFD